MLLPSGRSPKLAALVALAGPPDLLTSFRMPLPSGRSPKLAALVALAGPPDLLTSFGCRSLPAARPSSRRSSLSQVPGPAHILSDAAPFRPLAQARGARRSRRSQDLLTSFRMPLPSGRSPKLAALVALAGPRTCSHPFGCRSRPAARPSSRRSSLSQVPGPAHILSDAAPVRPLAQARGARRSRRSQDLLTSFRMPLPSGRSPKLAALVALAGPPDLLTSFRMPLPSGRSPKLAALVALAGPPDLLTSFRMPLPSGRSPKLAALVALAGPPDLLTSFRMPLLAHASV